MIATILLLTFFAIALIALEIFLPGGILGIAGLLCVGVALYLTFTSDDLDSIGAAGRGGLALGVVGSVVLGLVLFLRYFQRTSVGKQLTHSTAVGGKDGYELLAKLEGQEGIARSPLRPSGKAEIGGKKIDVVAEVGLIDPGTPVRVVRVEGSRIVVRAV
ncbi:MAG: NfeD family protein [Verrucomicrobiales bacterium]